jgi:hypothetical protein
MEDVSWSKNESGGSFDWQLDFMHLLTGKQEQSVSFSPGTDGAI